MTYSKFEKARILGARALQISMGAPILTKFDKNDMSPLKIAEKEMEEDVLPITVRQ